MRNTLITISNRLRASYWFTPSLMALAAIILSQIAINVDQYISIELAERFFPFYRTSPAGLRAVLSTTASSMITVAGVVFSLTMVVLSLTSQQYGSLVLENFMRDRPNQFVLGAFISTFLYCLLVLRTIQDGGDETFIPRIASLIGVSLAILSVGVLIYFIHHVSSSVQATTVIERASNDLLETIDTLYPESLGDGVVAIEGEPPRKPNDFDENLSQIPAYASGYAQLIDNEKLMEVATEHDLIISLFCRPGDFILESATVGSVYPKSRVTDDVLEAVKEIIQIGNRRTYKQDLHLAFNQLVEIAVRALSPGINAPFTAVSCIDHLSKALYELGRRKFPSAHRHDQDEALRVIAKLYQFEELLSLSFDQIRHYSRTNNIVACHLLCVLNAMQEGLKATPHHEAVREYLHTSWLEYGDSAHFDREKQALDACYGAFTTDA